MLGTGQKVSNNFQRFKLTVSQFPAWQRYISKALKNNIYHF